MYKNQSLNCPIQGDMKQIVRALDETERFAREEQMQKRDALHLRLLAEELLGMAGTLLQVEDGQYWIEKDQNGIDLHLIVKTCAGANAEDVLLSISSDHKNAAYMGVKGRIVQFLDMFSSVGDAFSPEMLEEHGPYVLHTGNAYQWSYRLYMEELQRDKRELLSGTNWKNRC